jgi:NitT/TauT family transport system permease protein
MKLNFLTFGDRGAARLWRAAIIIALFSLWEMAGRYHFLDNDILPPLSRIFDMMLRLINDRHFRYDAWITLNECLITFAIVVPAGLVTGFILGENQRLHRHLGPIFQLAMTTPKSIFLPVFILLFGIGIVEKIIFASVLTYFIIVPTGIAAVQSLSPSLLMMARSFGATKTDIYLRLYIPACLPLIISAIRLGLIFSMHGIIFAEMYASSEGIGRSILAWGESFDMVRLFAAVALVMIITISLNETLTWLEHISRRQRSGVLAA